MSFNCSSPFSFVRNDSTATDIDHSFYGMRLKVSKIFTNVVDFKTLLDKYGISPIKRGLSFLTIRGIFFQHQEINDMSNKHALLFLPMKENQKLQNFLAFPRSVLGIDLNETAIILYMLLLDRAKVSVINPDWISKDGIAFIRYPIEKLSQATRKSKTTVKTPLNQLEEQGLIKRVKQGIGKATLIYVYIPEDSILTTPGLENRPPQGQNSDHVQGKKTDPAEAGKLATNKITSSKTNELNNSN